MSAERSPSNRPTQSRRGTPGRALAIWAAAVAILLLAAGMPRSDTASPARMQWRGFLTAERAGLAAVHCGLEALRIGLGPVHDGSRVARRAAFRHALSGLRAGFITFRAGLTALRAPLPNSNSEAAAHRGLEAIRDGVAVLHATASALRVEIDKLVSPSSATSPRTRCLCLGETSVNGGAATGSSEVRSVPAQESALLRPGQPGWRIREC